MKINFLKIIKNLFRIFSIFLKPFSDKSPDWVIRWENKKNKKFPHGLLLIPHWAITADLPLG
jgi:hypothetical protein